MNARRAAPEFILLILLALTAGTAGLPDFSGIRLWIHQNAAIELVSDFRQRSDEWIQRDWSFRDGVARPKSPGFWRSAASLSNYRVEFSAQVDRGDFGWAWRARDARNYYANRLVVSAPSVVFERWVCIDGIVSDKVSVRLAATHRPGQVHSIAVSADGPHMVTELDGQTIDTWSDRRLPFGPPAFFSGSPDRANLYRARVLSQYTSLRRLLALFR